MQSYLMRLFPANHVIDRLYDLFALFFGSFISTLLILWQQEGQFIISINLFILVLVLFLSTALCYGIALFINLVWHHIGHVQQNKSIIFTLWSFILLFSVFIYISWIVAPVYLSGMRCDIYDNCTTGKVVYFHSSSLIPFDMRYTLTIAIWFLVYCIILPLGNSLLFRIIFYPHWIGRKMAVFWIISLVILNIILVSTLPIADRLARWYE
jgi:hypothetical protein